MQRLELIRDRSTLAERRNGLGAMVLRMEGSPRPNGGVIVLHTPTRKPLARLEISPTHCRVERTGTLDAKYA